MQEFIRIGVDLSEGFFQVHALEREGSPAVKRKLSRARFLAFFAGIAPCRIGMEACGSAITGRASCGRWDMRWR